MAKSKKTAQTASRTKAEAAKAPEKPKETPYEFVASAAAIFVTGLFILTFALQAFTIPSSSMENTLLIGDHLFVDRMTLAPPTRWLHGLIPYREPRRGDIFVFLSPAQPGLYIVKRVMGLPGDRIHLQNGAVYRNGQKLEEPYVIRCDADKERAGICVLNDAYRDYFPQVPPGPANLTPEWRLMLSSYIHEGEIVVPPGRIFAMGDNRDVSLDSRYWGFVPRENVIGRPMFIYWSFITPRDEYERQGLGDRIAWAFNIVVHFVDKTRWSRMLHVVR